MATISGCRHLKVNLKAKLYIYVNSTTQRCPNKIIKIFLLEGFFHRHGWQTLSCEYLYEFSKKIRNGPNGIIKSMRETDSRKNQKQNISWHCPFKQALKGGWIKKDDSKTAWLLPLYSLWRPSLYLRSVGHQVPPMENAWKQGTIRTWKQLLNTCLAFQQEIFIHCIFLQDRWLRTGSFREYCPSQLSVLVIYVLILVSCLICTDLSNSVNVYVLF